jgi:hypothetical protein
MEPFLLSIRASLEARNWLAALTTALLLPDICGFIEGTERGSEARYVAWFRRYVQPRYTGRPGNMFDHIFLSGNDCYALRCALLHEGTDETVGQRARQTLERFEFVTPLPGNINRHNNQNGTRLQLQVDDFCADMCRGAEQWLKDSGAQTSEARRRMSNLITIEHDVGAT